MHAFKMQFERWTAAAVPYIAEQMGGYKPFSGQGIRNYSNGTSLVRSVDPTPFYANNLSDLSRIAYTAEGQVGNQSLRTRGNRGLQEPGRRIFLLEVKKEGKHTRWIWHGEYVFRGEIEEMQHPDRNGAMRTIYRFILHKV